MITKMFITALLFSFSLLLINIVLSEDQLGCETYRTLLRTYDITKGKGTTNCCKLLGCFTNEDDSKFEHWPSAPWCLDRIKPEFHIYSPNSVKVNQTIDIFNLNESVKNLNISKNIEIYAIIHGWNTQWNLSNWMFSMKDALFKKGKNVIIVRWTEGSNMSEYVQAGANALAVGHALGLVLSTMAEYGKIDLNLTTIVGFSLGAHAAGFAGKNLTKGSLKRIIGLDPAGPMFACEDPATRLSDTDARFVQVIHTNGDPLTLFGRGTMQKLGHVDFYANGGWYQPGCEEGIKQSFTDMTRLNFSSIWSQTACSHARAPLLFTEMVSRSLDSSGNCSFMSFPCSESEMWHEGYCFNCSKGCPLPGIQTDLGTPFKGKYYFNTQSDEAKEFCGRQYLVTLTSDVDVVGLINLILRGPSGETSALIFQSAASKLIGNQPKTRVLVTPWAIDHINQILITYTKLTSILIEDGVKSFKITNSTIEYLNGTFSRSCSEVVVKTGEPKLINFQHC